MIRRLLMFVALLSVLAVPAWAGQVRIVPLDFRPNLTDTISVGMAESTLCVPTYGAARMTLTIKPSAVLFNQRIAILVKSCGDSTTHSGAVAMDDSSKTGVFQWHQFDSGTSTLNQPDSNVVRYAGPVASDTFMPGQEAVLSWIPDGAGKWGVSRGLTITLADNFGTPFVAQNIQIRLKYIGQVGTYANPIVYKGTLTLYYP